MDSIVFAKFNQILPFIPCLEKLCISSHLRFNENEFLELCSVFLNLPNAKKLELLMFTVKEGIESYVIEGELISKLIQTKQSMQEVKLKLSGNTLRVKDVELLYKEPFIRVIDCSTLPEKNPKV